MRKRLARLLEDISNATVIVIGDVMLDEYIIGDSERISPEAPEPIIVEHERIFVPGGAANVAVNIARLGARVELFGIIGEDPEGTQFREILRKSGVGDSGVTAVPGRLTNRKTRLIARGNQVLRVDRDGTAPLDPAREARLADDMLECAKQHENSVFIVSDYAKGTITPSLVGRLVESGRRVIVDPKSPDFGRYSGSYLITPNHAELSRAAGIETVSPADVEQPARTLMGEHAIENMLVTFGPEGMVLIEQDVPMAHIHAKAREVYDVTGAGDTVIATIGTAVSSGTSLADACFVANIAAGIVVGKHRAATASPKEIMDYAFGPSAAEKIVDRATLLAHLDELRASGKKIVFTNGCFDLLHVGHIAYLNDARDIGDILVVGLNTDRSIRALKGEGRPIINEQERSHLLAALECIDFVILFDEDTPIDLIRAVKPDFLVKGADYRKDGVVGHEVVESYGGEVKLIKLIDNISTSKIIDRIRENS